MINYKNIIKDCFWDSNIDEDELMKIVKNNNKREMKKLFSKIIYNSKDKIQALQLFTREQHEDFFSDFEVTYNKKYINKHVTLLKFLLLDEKQYIKGLDWKKR